MKTSTSYVKFVYYMRANHSGQNYQVLFSAASVRVPLCLGDYVCLRKYCKTTDQKLLYLGVMMPPPVNYYISVIYDLDL